MMSLPTQIKPEAPTFAVEWWPIGRVRPYPHNARVIPPSAVEKVACSIRAFGWRQPIVVDTAGVIVVGHVRLRAAESMALAEVPVHVARDLTPGQVKAYRLMDNRSHDEATWDLDLIGLELQSIQELDGDLDLELTGFDQEELNLYLYPPAEDSGEADVVLEPPSEPVTRPDDLWLCGKHRVLCQDSTTSEAVARLLGERKPLLMVTDPPYGIELDSEWRDRAGLNTAPGQKRSAASKAAAKANPQYPAEASYMRRRTEGHTETTISGDTRADWSEAFELVPSLQVAYVWHASKFTREVLNGLLRIGFEHHQQIIWDKGRAVLTRTLYWFQHEPCWFVRRKNAPWFGKAGENSTIWASPSPKFIMGGSDEEKFDHPTQKPVALFRRPILNHLKRGELAYEPFLGSGTTLAAAELTERVCYGLELDPKYVDVVVLRWQTLTGKQATLEGDGRTFEEIAVERRRGAA
jgi:DNA modification methylase